ncbi:hypothetical protein PCE1_003368 [Barthelona sp. PCE]
MKLPFRSRRKKIESAGEDIDIKFDQVKEEAEESTESNSMKGFGSSNDRKLTRKERRERKKRMKERKKRLKKKKKDENPGPLRQEVRQEVKEMEDAGNNFLFAGFDPDERPQPAPKEEEPIIVSSGSTSQPLIAKAPILSPPQKKKDVESLLDCLTNISESPPRQRVFSSASSTIKSPNLDGNIFNDLDDIDPRCDEHVHHEQR